MNIIYLGKIENKKVVTGGERQIHTLFNAIEQHEGSLYFVPTETIEGKKLKAKEIKKLLKQVVIELDIDKTIIISDYSKRFELLGVIYYSKYILGCKVCLLLGAFYFDYRNSKIKNLIDYLVSILIILPSDSVFTTGESVNNRIKKMGIRKKAIYAVYPAIRKTLVEQANSMELSQNRDYFIDKVQLINVGRFHKVKGYEYLIEAISLLSRKDVHLTIVGDQDRDQEYTKSIIEKIKNLKLKNQITLYGMTKDDKELADIYKYSDICIHSSVWESSPITVCEALMFGKPVIATDVGGTSEYLTNEYDSLLVPSKNPEVMANSIRKLIDDFNLYNTLATNARKSGKKYIDRTWEHVGDEYYQLLLNVFEMEV